MTTNSIELVVDETQVVVVDSAPTSVSLTTPGPTEVSVATGGIQGPIGTSNTLSPGVITTGAPGSNVLATITGTSPNQVLNLTIPRGDVGATGTIAIGTTTTGAAGSNAAVTNTGTSTAAVFNFTVPRGNTGLTGPANVLTIGTISNVATGGAATATITGTAPNQVLNLGLPIGATGPANTLTVGTVTALTPAATPTVAITGAAPTQTISFGIPQGAEWLQGAVAPATGTGVVGDWYINTATSDYYEKTAAAVWTLRGNLKGLTGNIGPANTLSIAGVTTGAEGSNATVTVGGTSPNQTLTFAIPRGNTGPANVLSIGSTTTGAPGTNAAVSITGTAPSQILNLTIPRGDTGLTGPANTLSIGTVSTVAAGGSATASITGTAPTQTLNIGIPTGATGATGLAGSRWYQGSGAPATGTGVLNDYYLNTNTVTGTGDVYQKTGASTWTLIGNIRGIPGAGNVVTVNGDAGPNVVISYATLGVVPASSLPPLAINEWFEAASQAAMLALTAQRGDMVRRSDTGQVFFLASDSPSTLADWKEVSDNAPVTSVAGRIGDVVLTKADVGLNLVDNVADASKPVSGPQQTALNLKANLASPTFTGTVSGITSTMVGLGNVPNIDMRNISNVTSGTIPNAQLPARLGIVAVNNSTDFNTLTENGLYSASNGAANAPVAGQWWYVTVVAYTSNNDVYQRAVRFGTTETYERQKSSSVWSAWTRVYGSATELNTLYALVGHNHDSVYMNLTTAQTIAGIKTFSSSPVVPVNSWTIASTAGLQAALDSKSATTHVHPLTDASITGILPLAKGGTGNAYGALPPGAVITAATTTAMGVTAVGTAGQFLRSAGASTPTWYTLTASDIGLGSVNNTADLAKPISTATQTAVDLKLNKASTGTAGSYTYREIYRWYQAVPSSADNLVVETNLDFNGAMLRGRVVLNGLNGSNTGDGGFNLYLYSTGGGTIHVPTWTFNGTHKVTLRMAKNAGNKLVLIFSAPDVPWQYPTISFEELVGGYADPGTAGVTGWNANLVTEANVTTTYGSTIVAVTNRNAIQDAVLLAGNQTITGIKTFTSAPVVPDASWTIAKTSGLQAALDLKAPLASPTFTGTVSGITAAMVGAEPSFAAGTTAQYRRGDKTWQTLDKAAVGLSAVDNTADSAKPVSTAQQTALNLKANLNAPTFTGTVSGITAAMVGLGNVPNIDMRNISNVTSGTIPNAQLPLRLGAGGHATVGDWNLALETGWYSASDALNSPEGVGGWCQVTVHQLASNPDYVIQTATNFLAFPAEPGGGRTWRRTRSAGVWGSWTRMFSAANSQVFYYTTGSEARPTGSTYVEWRGPGGVTPTNAINGDSWVATS